MNSRIRSIIMGIKSKMPKNIDQSVFFGAPKEVSAAFVTHEGVVFWISGKIERLENGNWYFEEITNVGTPRGYRRKRKPIPLLHSIILRSVTGDDMISIH